MRGAGQIAELAAIAEPDVGVDRQRRPGPPRAARLDRGDRRGEGRADRAACRPDGDRGRPGRRAAARARTCATDVRDASTFGAAAATSTTLPGRAARRSPFDVARTCAATRSRRWPPRAPSASSRRARVRGRALARCAASAIALAGRGRRHQRLLQRQPDVDARRPRRPRRDGARAPRRRARRHARARPRRARASTTRSARTPRDARRRPAGHRRRRSPRRHGAALRRRRPRRRRRRARRPRCCPSCVEPGDTVLVKGSRGVGLEVVAEALEARGGLSRWARCSSAGTAVAAASASSSSPKFIAFLRDREFGQHIREEGPRATTRRPGTPTMGGDHHPHRDLGPVPDPHATTTGAAVGVFGVGDRLRRARLRRRLHEDRQAPLARPARRARSSIVTDR